MKEKEPDLDQALENLADKADQIGERNLAIVLLTYLGSKKCGMESFFAARCKDFAKEGIDTINAINKNKNN